MSVDECEKKISITDEQKLVEFSLREKQGLQMVRNMFQWANCRGQSHGSENCERDYDSYITTVIENVYAAACFCFIREIPRSFAQVSLMYMLVAQDTVHQQRIFYSDNLYVNRFVCDEMQS